MNLSFQEEQELRANPLFRPLSGVQLRELQQGIVVKGLTTGDHLFEAGHRADNFYLIRRGKIKLYRLSPSGQEKVIEIIGQGNTFAEALMFHDIPEYPVSAQALSEVEIFAINNRAFLNILGQSIETCFQVMADISVRLKRHLNEIDALTLQNAALRVINYLGYLIPEGSREAAEITLPAAKNIIASRLSITPETLSRILNTLSGKGLISVDGLHIKVYDVERLRTYCN